MTKGDSPLAARNGWAIMRRMRRAEGVALVEFAVSCLILLPMFFGFIETCLAFYSYNFVADAAREATRYACVRGSTSCANSRNQLLGCDLQTSAEIQSYVQGLGYPGARNLTATISFARVSTTGPTTWTPCGSPCNQPGNQVQVNVRYSLPIGIPFWTVTKVSFGSTSSMVITQ